MKTGLVVGGPDVDHSPLALLSGAFEEKVARAAELGFDGIELMVRDPTALDWPAVRSAVASAGLQVSQVVTGELFAADGLCLATADEDLRSRAVTRTRSVIELAAYLGTMMNIGRLRGQLRFLGNIPNAWSVAVEHMREVISYAAEQNVKVTIEPINRYETDFVFSASDGMRLLTELDCDNAGLMLDLFHMNIEDVSIEEGLRLAGNRLWHVHVADSNRRYPGCGHLNFDSIFATLKDMGYHGYLSAEILPLPDPDTAAQKTISFLQRYVAQAPT
jgi:sugar phosphate isomerase/epimerase